MSADKFTRYLKSLEGMYYRLDKGISGGRNSASTDATMEARVREMQAAISADAHTDDTPLCSFLDDNPKVAARWNKVERRFFGCRA